MGGGGGLAGIGQVGLGIVSFEFSFVQDNVSNEDL